MPLSYASTAFKTDSAGAWIDKDPQASKPYILDWYEFLRGNDQYWSPNAQVHINQTTTPSNSRLNGNRYKVISGGATGNVEPLWPTGSGATVQDGSVVWQQIGLEDTIAASVWTVAAGITQVSAGQTSTTTQTQLSGGAAGTSYVIDNKITSVAGVIESHKFRLVVSDL